MLAKYIPGGVWTPAARVVAARRAGVDNTSVVLATILLEAGLSAVAGVIVLAASLPFVSGVDAPVWPVVGFAVLATGLLHPRVFSPLATRLSRRFGGGVIEPLPWGTAIGVLIFYAFTWVVGGAALTALLAAVGAHPGAEAIAYLGGASAVGAIVAVVTVIFPSGLGRARGRRGRVHARARARERRRRRRRAQPARDHDRRGAAAGRRRRLVPRPPALVSCAGMTFAVPARERPKPRTAPDHDRLAVPVEVRTQTVAAALAKRGILTAGDLLETPPRAWRDYSEGVTALADVVVGRGGHGARRAASRCTCGRRGAATCASSRRPCATTRAPRPRSGSTRASSRARCRRARRCSCAPPCARGAGSSSRCASTRCWPRRGRGCTRAAWSPSTTPRARSRRASCASSSSSTCRAPTRSPIRCRSACASPRRLPLRRDAIAALHAPQHARGHALASDRLAYEELLLLQVALAERRAGAPAAEPLGRPGELLERYRASLPFTLTIGPEAQRARHRPRPRARRAPDAAPAARRRRLGQDRRRGARDAARRRARARRRRCSRPPRCSSSSTPRPCAASSSRSGSRSR